VPSSSSGSARFLVLLSRWRIDAAWLAVPMLLLAHPTMASIDIWLPLVVGGLALRTWARGYIERAQYLTQAGPYALIRHPLYVGSFLLGLAFAAMTRVLWLPPLFVLLFLVMYVPKATREEVFLRGVYGDAYASYATRVRAFVPHLHAAPRPAAAAAQCFHWRRVFRQGEWQTWLGALLVMAVMWWETGSAALLALAG